MNRNRSSRYKNRVHMPIIDDKELNYFFLSPSRPKKSPFVANKISVLLEQHPIEMPIFRDYSTVPNTPRKDPSHLFSNDKKI